MKDTTTYTEENIRSLDWKEHIRMRPGMYIGKLGDGSSPDDGIYILLKEVLDNCVDEFVMGAGKTIEITIKENVVKVRDYGRGIPLGKVVDVVSKMNTGGKYDSRAFKKSVGLSNLSRALCAPFITGVFEKSFGLSKLLRALYAPFITGVFKKSFGLSSFLECK